MGQAIEVKPLNLGVYGPFSQLGISPWLMLRVAVAQAYLAFGISQLLSVNMPSQSTATVTVMLFLVVAQLCSGVDMISFKDMRDALEGVPRRSDAPPSVLARPSREMAYEGQTFLHLKFFRRRT